MSKRVSGLVLTVISLMLASVLFFRASTLPKPERACPVVLDWHGIKPGQSSQDDVIRSLGQPIQRGSYKFYDDQDIAFFTYPVSSGRVSQLLKHRVYFRSDGMVNWIEEIVADRDGPFYSAQETINQLGNELDVAYRNNSYIPNVWNYDVLSGPDYLYVWAECGLALNVIESCAVADHGCVNEPIKVVTSTLMLRHVATNVQSKPMSGIDKVVLMRFLFPPTSYEGFAKFYEKRIPFGIWETYLKIFN
jgi:hypothetical protein